jgi:cytidylate kinase
MTVITLSREIGSEGASIANELARRLNYNLIDKNVLEKILNQYGFVQFEQEYETTANFWERLDKNRFTMIEMLNRVILAAASLGNVVILGRGSFAVLGGFSDVLNVRLQAPFAVRVRRTMIERNIEDLGSAEALIKESDRVRSAFMQSWYGVRWDTASYFDLVIDTSKINREKAITWILDAQQTIANTPQDEKNTLAALKIDPVMAKTIRAALDSSPIPLR